MIPGLAVLAFAADPQPVERDHPGEQLSGRRFDELDLNLQIELDFALNRVRGVATHTLQPIGQPDAWARFHQRGLTIEKVWVDGEEVTGWRQGEDTVDVPLGAGSGNRVVALRYSGMPESGLYFRTAKGEVPEVWTQGEGEDNRYWYPGWDQPNDRFSVTTAITAPGHMRAFGIGALVGREDKPNGDAVTTYRMDRAVPNYLVTVAAGDYIVVDDPDSKIPAQYAGPEYLGEERIRASLDDMPEMVAWFADELDEPYPWPAIRGVFVQRFIYGAMENPSLITYNMDRYVLPEDLNPRGVEQEQVRAHELVHHWFGDLVTNHGWRESWLNEGFAEFYAAKWLQHAHGDEVFADYVRGWNDAAADSNPLAANNWTKVGDEQSSHVYTRGAAVLHGLEVMLGDDVLRAGVRRYLDEHHDRFVETDDFRRALEESSGEELGWWFDAWVHGGSAPSLDVRSGWADGVLTITVEQTVDDGVQPFDLPMQIEVGTDGEPVTQTVWIGAGTTKATISVAEAPRYVAVDPRAGLIAHWTIHQTPAEWRAQLDSKHANARLDALVHLGEGPKDDETITVLGRFAGDTTLPISTRGAAIGSLGDLGALDVLLARAADPDPLVRDRVADELGTMPKDPRITAKLQTLAKDKDPLVRGASYKALAHHDEKAALAWARGAVSKPDAMPRQWERASAADILGDHGGEGDLPKLLAQLGSEVPRPTRNAAARGAARLCIRLPDVDRGALNRTLEAFLHDQDIRTRQLGIELLGKVGDESAARYLDEYGKSTAVPELRDAAWDAASQIRAEDSQPKKGDAPPDPKEIELKLQDLERRLKRLEIGQ